MLIIDNFMHEHLEILQWHDEINHKMARGDPARIETTKMLAWIEPKTQHKRMRERLYQLNLPVILVCGAERKIAMVKQTEGKDKGKTIPVDQGYVPICGADIPWAMTISLMLEDVARPGVPRPIKALLPALKPIIRLDRPLDEETGRRIAAWARGEKEPVPGERTGSEVREETTATSGNAVPQEPSPSMPPPEDPGEGQVDDTPPPDPPPAEDEPVTPPASDSTDGQPPPPKPRPTEADIAEGARALGAKFLATADRKEYFAVVDDADVRKQMAWLKKNRRELYDREVEAPRKASWTRTDSKTQQQQGGLG